MCRSCQVRPKTPCRCPCRRTVEPPNLSARALGYRICGACGHYVSLDRSTTPPPLSLNVGNASPPPP